MKTIMHATAIVLTLCCVSHAQDQASRQFLSDAIEASHSEIRMGELALKNGQSGAVKTYGETLQTEHVAANEKAIAAAKSLGINAPGGPNARQQAEISELAQISGPAFDRAFAKRMIEHRTTIEAYEQAAAKQDAAGTYATEMLPMLRRQQERAQSLRKDVD